MEVAAQTIDPHPLGTESRFLCESGAQTEDPSHRDASTDSCILENGPGIEAGTQTLSASIACDKSVQAQDVEPPQRAASINTATKARWEDLEDDFEFHEYAAADTCVDDTSSVLHFSTEVKNLQEELDTCTGPTGCDDTAVHGGRVELKQNSLSGGCSDESIEESMSRANAELDGQSVADRSSCSSESGSASLAAAGTQQHCGHSAPARKCLQNNAQINAGKTRIPGSGRKQSSGKGTTKNVELANICNHYDVNHLLDELGSRTYAVFQSSKPRQHSDYRSLHHKLKEVAAIAPYESEIHFYISAILEKLEHA